MTPGYMQGIRTLVAVNSSVVVEHEGDFKAQGEYWRYYPDDSPFRGLHAGDTRAAVAPYLAHHVSHEARKASADSWPPYLGTTNMPQGGMQVFGDSYKWLLYGDDDTMWFIEGVLKYVQTLDHDLPYFVTGGLASLVHGDPDAPHWPALLAACTVAGLGGTC